MANPSTCITMADGLLGLLALLTFLLRAAAGHMGFAAV